MTNKTEELKLVLCKGFRGSRVMVSLDSFLVFNSQQDHDLDVLVNRWADFITPSSERAVIDRT